MNRVVQGGSVFLRKLERSDLERTYDWLHRTDIHSRIGVKVPFTRRDQEIWFDQLPTQSNKVVFAVCHTMDQRHIGNVSLDMIDLRHRNARFSIFIADVELRGKGLGSEALMLLEQHAFRNLQLHKIWCKTDAGFPELLSFYEKHGFTREGCLREHEFKDGRFVDKILFAKFNR